MCAAAPGPVESSSLYMVVNWLWACLSFSAIYKCKTAFALPPSMHFTVLYSPQHTSIHSFSSFIPTHYSLHTNTEGPVHVYATNASTLNAGLRVSAQLLLIDELWNTWKSLYRLIELHLLLQVQLHHSVIVIDAVAMKVVHLSCEGKTRKVTTQEVKFIYIVHFHTQSSVNVLYKN